MDGPHMVPLASTRSAFEAQLIAARLGSEGILWQLRGGSVDSVYPVGAVDVLVAEEDLDRAVELLGTEEPDPDGGANVPASRSPDWWVAAAVVVAIVIFICLRILSL